MKEMTSIAASEIAAHSYNQINTDDRLNSTQDGGLASEKKFSRSKEKSDDTYYENRVLSLSKTRQQRN